jgi:hypothetical protein
MPSLIHIHLDLPEAARLADLAGIESDLKTCREYIDLLLRRRPILDNLAAELAESRPLMIASFVLYGRCFKGGARSKTEAELEAQIDGADREPHQRIIDIRDKFVAHSVNSLEEHRVRVWLYPRGRQEGLFGVTIESFQSVIPPSEIFHQMIALCEKHLAWVAEQSATETAILNSLVAARYSAHELYAMQPNPDRSPDFGGVHRRRKQM